MSFRRRRNTEYAAFNLDDCGGIDVTHVRVELPTWSSPCKCYIDEPLSDVKVERLCHVHQQLRGIIRLVPEEKTKQKMSTDYVIKNL